MSDFMTVAEFAARVDKTEAWVRAQARTGRITSLKIGRDWRFAESDLTAYIESCRFKAADPLAQTRTSRARKRRAS